ncbi:MAG TPA: hypothetical protein VEQ65_02780 [Opitutus sp.]|nr:hypothetical protein [Opitutus sp.]
MAVQIIPILRALAPLVLNAGSVVATLRSSGGVKTEDRVARLEQETLRAGEVLTGLAQQLQAIAEELRVQAEQTEAMRRQARLCLIVAGVALLLSVTALVVAVR